MPEYNYSEELKKELLESIASVEDVDTEYFLIPFRAMVEQYVKKSQDMSQMRVVSLAKQLLDAMDDK